MVISGIIDLVYWSCEEYFSGEELNLGGAGVFMRGLVIPCLYLLSNRYINAGRPHIHNMSLC